MHKAIIPVPSPAETARSRYIGNGSELQAFPHLSLVPLLPFFLVQKNLFLFSTLISFLFSGSQALALVLGATHLTSVSVIMKLRVTRMEEAPQLQDCRSEK